MMKDYSEKLIEAKTLANNITVSLFDLCKPVAADRWYVKILCRLELPPDKLGDIDLEGDDLQAFFEEYRQGLFHEFAKERNFVDDKAKDDVVAEVLAHIKENALKYIENSVFSENLVRQKVDEFRQKCLVKRELGMDTHEEEEEGPADFSACFRD